MVEDDDPRDRPDLRASRSQIVQIPSSSERVHAQPSTRSRRPDRSSTSVQPQPGQVSPRTTEPHLAHPCATRHRLKGQQHQDQQQQLRDQQQQHQPKGQQHRDQQQQHQPKGRQHRVQQQEHLPNSKSPKQTPTKTNNNHRTVRPQPTKHQQQAPQQTLIANLAEKVKRTTTPTTPTSTTLTSTTSQRANNTDTKDSTSLRNSWPKLRF
ncbi:unnamed protein product [Tilletia caries]|nr:unnamed protein product [Tilletia caries]